MNERFEGWLGSLRKKKAGKKVEEAKATKKETARPIQAEELAQVEEAFQPEIQEPTDDFFDNVISEKGAGTEEVVGLNKEVKGAVEAAEIAKVPDKENKESKDKDSADDFIELKPVDEAFDDKKK